MLQVILPIGISFYTFEAINYTVDVYRRRSDGRAKPAPLHALHPLLPAPGGRADRPGARLPAPDPAAEALGLALACSWARSTSSWACSRNWPSPTAWPSMPTRSSPTRQCYGSGAVWLAVLAYALQIYCDFSGYTDMALGAAHMLGYKLCQNFNMPYLAANVSEFWRRWHISLSTWLRDYLFIPLGGSRGSAGRPSATC